MEEIYKNYLQYDFDNSEEFKDFKEKFPLEPNETIEDHKKSLSNDFIFSDYPNNEKTNIRKQIYTETKFRT